MYNRPMRRRILEWRGPVAAAVLGAAGTFLSCTSPPPPERAIDTLYERLSERRADFPADAVRGKVIVIDPGHGGRFDGTTGRDGLKEKDVNLGVALYLWGLLREAGARPLLTRSSDIDLLPGDGGGSLADDLARRVAMADTASADLFLSIHHNARSDTDRTVNRIEVYYPMGRTGASLDAGRAVAQHLSKNLGIPDASVLPGNFYVLRENSRVAVLGESSYLSHPPVEAKLALGEKRRLEAEAYFLGIVAWFARGVPACAIDRPEETVTSSGGLVLRGKVSDAAGGEGIDPATVEATLDGAPLDIVYDVAGGLVETPLPADLAPGKHVLSLAARNLAGNAAPEQVRVFDVSFPPVRAAADVLRLPVDEPTILLALTLFDERNLPVKEGMTIRADPGGEERVGPGGMVRFTLRGESLPQVRLGTAEDTSRALHITPGAPEMPAGVLLAEEGGRPVPGALVFKGREPVGKTGPGGWLALEARPARTDRFTVRAGGRLATRIDFDGAVATARFDLPNESPLAGTVILIDPEGADEPRLFPPSGQCLALGRYLEGMVRWAGGKPHLTRDSPDFVPAAERISLAARDGADYWITVRTEEAMSVRHFPGSRLGAPAARSVAAALSEALGVDVPVLTGAERVLRDTPCPALVVALPPVEDGRAGRGRLRRAAQAILEGLALRLGAQERSEPISIGSLSPGSLVRIDRSVTFQTLSGDTLIIRFAPKGDHRIEVERDGVWSKSD